MTQRRNNPRTLHRLRSSFQHYTSRLTWPAEPRWCEGCEKTAASAPSYSPRFPPGQLTQRYAACAAPAEHDVEVALRAALSGLRARLVREKTALSDLWFIFGRGRRPERLPQLSH